MILSVTFLMVSVMCVQIHLTFYWALKCISPLKSHIFFFFEKFCDKEFWLVIYARIIEARHHSILPYKRLTLYSAIREV
jgi:hypothetical protein